MRLDYQEYYETGIKQQPISQTNKGSAIQWDAFGDKQASKALNARPHATECAAKHVTMDEATTQERTKASRRTHAAERRSVSRSTATCSAWLASCAVNDSKH